MDVSLPQLLGLDTAEYRQFDRYLVTGFLGEGAKAKVLLGRDQQLGREVAIKLSSALIIDSDESMRFYREAKALAEIDHPNVVRVLDYSGPQCPTPFLIIERLRGVDLQTLVEGRPLDEGQVCAIGYMLASAIAAMHARGIIHRDIKPENAMLTPEGRVVLIDFGFCKGFRSEALSRGETFVDNPTKCVGTPAFSSPEQLRGKHLSKTSDVFSLGATLYFLASEVLPFASESLIQLIDMVVNKEPFPLSHLVPVSPELERLIADTFEKDPLKRLRVGDALKGNLFKLAARAGVPPDDVLRELAEQRQVSTRKPHVLHELGTDVASMRRALHLDSLELLREETVWAARHAPEPTRVVAPKIAQHQEERTRALQRPPRTGNLRLVLAIIFAIVLVAASVSLALVMRRAPSASRVSSPSATAALPLPVPAQSPSSVRLVVKPWGKVFVDGEERGTTPALRVLQLNAGNHHFAVENPQYGRVERDVEIASGAAEMVIQFDLVNR